MTLGVASYPGDGDDLVKLINTADRYLYLGKARGKNNVSDMGRDMQITGEMNVRRVLVQYPQALDIFIRHGFTPMKNPVLRFFLTRLVTIEQAAKKHHLPLEPLLEDLNKAVKGEK